MTTPTESRRVLDYNKVSTMTKCIVKDCHSNSGTDSGVLLHGFPSSLDLIKLWLQQTGNSFSDIDAFARNVLYSRSDRYQMCSKHFSPKSYVTNGTKMVLKQDAVPTLFQEAQCVSKGPSCQKVREEADARLHSASSKAYVENRPTSPQHRQRNLHTDEQENSECMEEKQCSTVTMKMIDKAVGTDSYYDIIESKIEKMLNKRLLNIAMEIITMLAGEEYMMVKKNSHVPNTSKNEVPVKCGDVSISFSMDEWDYIENHKDLYQEVMAESDQRPSSCSPPEEPAEPCNEFVTQTSVTDNHEDGQTRENFKQVDVATNTFTSESSTASSDQEIEELCVNDSMETIDEQEEAYTDDSKSSDFGEEPYIMTCSPGEMVEDGKTMLHGSQAEDEEGSMPAESPKQAMENLAYSSTSGQCEEQAWSDYERYVGDPSYTSGEPVQIKEENSQFNYNYSEEPAFIDPNPTHEERSELFDTMNNLLIHQITFGQSSSADKPYACSHCEKRFAKRSHLGMHLKTHTGERPYACADCGKKFTRRSNMLTHYRTHTGEKPFACPKCGKRFTQSSHMVTHQRTHSSDKLFSCPECKKRFTKWSYLNFHLRTHGIEKLNVP
ncbi:zinc finger protein 436-like isoform X1 [Rana temporaria]|uniref:zinc finger protein 436-like isoform X1 n=2 Tax=Rana temporaria TaxID=8407 RepID=UPI001AAD8335|nr:zinc finger protein 436-like isoform X1 [Rana temporaria]